MYIIVFHWIHLQNSQSNKNLFLKKKITILRSRKNTEHLLKNDVEIKISIYLERVKNL